MTKPTEILQCKINHPKLYKVTAKSVNHSDGKCNYLKLSRKPQKAKILVTATKVSEKFHYPGEENENHSNCLQSLTNIFYFR